MGTVFLCLFESMKLVVCLSLFGVCVAKPQFSNPLTSISGALINAKGSLRDVVNKFTCASLPNDGKTCAILFDEDDCGGWQLNVGEGYTEIPDQSTADFIGGSFVDNPKKDDAEAVLVKEGCVLVAYEETREKGFNKGAAVAAVNSDQYAKFEDLTPNISEDVKSVECRCNVFEFSKQGSNRG